MELFWGCAEEQGKGQEELCCSSGGPRASPVNREAVVRKSSRDFQLSDGLGGDELRHRQLSVVRGVLRSCLWVSSASSGDPWPVPCLLWGQPGTLPCVEALLAHGLSPKSLSIKCLQLKTKTKKDTKRSSSTAWGMEWDVSVFESRAKNCFSNFSCSIDRSGQKMK